MTREEQMNALWQDIACLEYELEEYKGDEKNCREIRSEIRATIFAIQKLTNDE